ncbi:MAG: transposase [Treponema sp.]|nr:transposase [Treponema sp.]
MRQGVWYEIRTRINNREPLFRWRHALALFDQVFGETSLRFVFMVCGLRLVDDWLTFYIKPANGLKLPAIMQWLKQTFALRYNRDHGRIGHLWGDRYWSEILEREPPIGEESGRSAARAPSIHGVSPHSKKRAKNSAGPPKFPLPKAPNPG